MEHILQFGISIDEDKIIKTATDKAADEIISSVRKEINDYKRGYQECRLDRIFREEIKKLLEVEKERIIESAISTLVANMNKTKAVRDKLKEI